MEALIPLLIVGAGILYSLFSGNAEQSKNTGRNIDKGKLNNPKQTRSLTDVVNERQAPRQSGREAPRQSGNRGFLGEILEELERGLSDFETESRKARESVDERNPIERKKKQLQKTRDTGRTVVRETIGRSEQRAREKWDEIGDQVQRDIGDLTEVQTDTIDVGRQAPNRERTRTRDRTSRNQKVAERAEMLRQKNRADRIASDITRIEGVGQSVTRESADAARYRLTDEDLIKHGEIGGYTFKVNRKTVLDGIIFSEILNKPKSKLK